MRDARPCELVEIIHRRHIAVVVLEQLLVDAAQHVDRDRLPLLDEPVRLQLVIGKHHLRVEGPEDGIDRVLQQQEALLRVGGGLEELVEQETLVGRRGDFGHKDGVVGRHEGLAVVGQRGVHGMAGLVREGEDRVEGVVVVQQQVGADPVDTRAIGAAALAVVLVHIDPAAGNKLPVFRHIVVAQRRHRRDDEVLRSVVGIDLLAFEDRNLPVVEVVGLQPQQLLAQLEVTLQRCSALARGLDQVRDHGGRNVVAVKGGVQGGRVIAGLRREPAALEHTVVDRRIGVGGGGIGLEISLERLRPVRLVVVGLQHRLVGPGCEGGFLAVTERDLRELDVRGAEFLEDRRGCLVETRGEGHQPLALLVEHVRLLAVVVEDRELVDAQRRGGGDPLLHGRLRDGQQLGREPCRRGAELREHRADPLELARDLLVAGVHIALELRIPVDLVLQHADLVKGLVGLQHGLRAALERALQRGKGVHLQFHVLHAGVPRSPVGIDGRKFPAVLLGNFSADAGFGFGVGGGHGSRQSCREQDKEQAGMVHDGRKLGQKPRLRRVGLKES